MTGSPMGDVNRLKRIYNLQPHAEGGSYVRIWKSDRTVVLPTDSGENKTRACGSSTYFLLEEHSYMRWHKQTCADEVFNWHAGGRMKTHLLLKDGSHRTKILGDTLEDEAAVYHLDVPHGTWVAGSVWVGDKFCLFGCAVYPGFEYEDWTLGSTQDLIKEFPEYRSIIEQFPN